MPFYCPLADKSRTLEPVNQEDIMIEFLIAAVLIGIGFAGIAVKIWAKEDGEFAGTCASNSPFLNKEGEACSFCGARPDEKCKNDDSSSSKKSDEEFSPFLT